MSLTPLMTDEEVALAVRLRREEKLSFRAIGRQMFYNYRTVERAILRVDPELRYYRSPADGERCALLHEQGLSWRQVATHTRFKTGYGAQRAARRWQAHQEGGKT